MERGALPATVYGVAKKLDTTEQVTHTHMCSVSFSFSFFIYFLLHWVFIAAGGLSLAVTSGSYSLV